MTEPTLNGIVALTSYLTLQASTPKKKHITSHVENAIKTTKTVNRNIVIKIFALKE